MPDPKLKFAAEEIKEILRRYDIAGSVALASRTHGEYLMHVSPSWSCLTMTAFRGEQTRGPRDALPHSGYIRIKATEAGYGSKAARNQAIRDTVGMVTLFASTSVSLLKNVQALLERLRASGMEITGENIEEPS